MPPTASPFSTNFPSDAPDLIGREIAARHLLSLLSAHRVVTLTGPGGIGKTVLALNVARSLFPTFDGDGFVVELLSLSDPNLLPSAVAGVLGLKLGGDEISPTPSRGRSVGRSSCLFSTIASMSSKRPPSSPKHSCVCVRGASILATSREILRIKGEHVFRPPLDVPPQHLEEAGTVLEHSAVRLFIARTTASGWEISRRRDDLSAIAAICRHLDGIPLAIEFAAARAVTLGVQQVAKRLDDRFKLLTTGQRTALPRHQTLRAALDWSYELLPEPERCLLRRAAVFPAGFTLEAATAVMSGTGNDPQAVADGISNLVAKSLLTLEGTAPSGRWQLLETIRAYAIEKLAECGDGEQANMARGEFFRDLFVTAAPGSQPQPSAAEMARYADEIDNVRASIDWCFSSSGNPGIGVALTAAYAPVWLDLSLAAELCERAERALEVLTNSDLARGARLRMELQIALGISLIITMGSVERTRIVLNAAVDLAESLDDLDAQVRALWALWAVHFNAGDCFAAQSAAERFSRLGFRAGDPAVASVGDRIMGYTLHYRGHQGEARNCFERALVRPKDQRDRTRFLYDQHVLARAMLARSLWLQGFADQAAAVARASVASAQATNDQLTLCFVLAMAVCQIALMTGDHAGAEPSVTRLIDAATKQSFTQYVMVGRWLEGALLIERRDFERGTALVRATLEKGEGTGWMACYPTYLGTLAQGLAGLGRIAEALATIEQALAKADRGGERWYLPELLRIKGEVLLQSAADGSAAEAEDCFVGAIDVSRDQGALFWELRGALSLARLRVSQNRQEDARRILAPVYGRFPEAVETADLRCARVMLEAFPT